MAESLQTILLQSIKESEERYNRLVLLIGQTGSGKTIALQELSKELGVKIINVNLVLSKLLLEMTAKQRSLQLPKLFEDILKNNEGTVILDNIEILFDISIKQDPLRLLRGVSRNRNVVVSWNGKIDGTKLIYAEPGHLEFRTYETTDLLTVTMPTNLSNVNQDGIGYFNSETKNVEEGEI